MMGAAVALQVLLAPQLVSIEQSPSQQAAISVKASIENPSNVPVTMLKWGTPFDPKAGILGVFNVQDETDGQAVPLDTIKISRKLPPAADDLLEISPQSTVDTVVTLPPMPLMAEHNFSIRAQGRWHAVWESPVSDVDGAKLEQLSDAKRGDFESNTVQFQVK
ncbi:hypothetical protein ETB97_012616 [Aspergillus alliaceus]|uniref:Uncharacterized protein n=1 Tax=Petromyces alliaceus TaxID=209559 RepID=A0A5N7CPC3_PETAA|nr:uncharacterized protein BDW43DRAFT_26073 [Aspergillus alliaceus]KAB8235775.1 hypothetical protein BDW43DRAFT_26073 [Aspergillus alliaceus]KAE8396031.1 hypothetical protein BDV23DRAFT_65905 [Aspergillus alliaceus]KAF5861739.1 hypothetical protein ETB97_012616 [Aspergillus burnettii]